MAQVPIQSVCAAFQCAHCLVMCRLPLPSCRHVPLPFATFHPAAPLIHSKAGFHVIMLRCNRHARVYMSTSLSFPAASSTLRLSFHLTS